MDRLNLVVDMLVRDIGLQRIIAMRYMVAWEEAMTRHVTVTPKMVCDVLNRSAPRDTPERRLWTQVLTVAVRDSVKKPHVIDCAAFFKSRWYSVVCDLAGLDREYVRGLLSRIGSKVEVGDALLTR